MADLMVQTTVALMDGEMAAQKESHKDSQRVAKWETQTVQQVVKLLAAT